MCERFQIKDLKTIAGTLIIVLSIQFKQFKVFVGTRWSSIVNSTVPIIMKCASYICIRCLDWFETNKEECTIPCHRQQRRIRRYNRILLQRKQQQQQQQTQRSELETVQLQRNWVANQKDNVQFNLQVLYLWYSSKNFY